MLFRSDVERKRLCGYELGGSSAAPVDQGLYSPAATDRTYLQLAELVIAIVRSGFSAVVDATFLQRKHRDLLRDTARTLGVPVYILDFQARPETIRQRVLQRQQGTTDASDADLQVVSHQWETQDPLSGEEERRVITVDTPSCGANQSLERQLRDILADCQSEVEPTQQLPDDHDSHAAIHDRHGHR